MKNLYKFPSLSIYFSLIIIFVGFFQLTKLNISLYPETSQAKIRVSLSPQGIDSFTFKEEYGKKIEANLLSTEGMEKVEGFYQNNSSYWRITFPWDYDSKKALNDVNSSLASISASLPKEWGGFHTFNSGSNTDLYLSIKTKKLSNQQLINLLEKNIEPQVKALEGVDSVFFSNPDSEFIVIKLNPEKMTRLSVFPKDIKTSLKKVLYDKYLGTFSSAETQYNLSVPLKITSLEK
jgi:multidrug efflux pump